MRPHSVSVSPAAAVPVAEVPVAEVPVAAPALGAGAALPVPAGARLDPADAPGLTFPPELAQPTVTSASASAERQPAGMYPTGGAIAGHPSAQLHDVGGRSNARVRPVAGAALPALEGSRVATKGDFCGNERRPYSLARRVLTSGTGARAQTQVGSHVAHIRFRIQRRT